MVRTSLKIVGASGQGIDSIGEVVAKALKRAGYCVFGYREYPSLIKGGHASYQLDFSDEEIRSTETTVNIVIALNHHGLEINVPDLKVGGILIHSTESWKFPKEIETLIKERDLKIIEFPVEKILKEMKAKPILGNMLLTSFVWAILGQKADALKEMVRERFAKKKDVLDVNMLCIDTGTAEQKKHDDLHVPLPKSKKKWAEHLLITGSKAMGLGAVHAGVRLYAGYPMTPSSPLLSYIAGIQNETGMVIKQAEDEITAAQIVSGAMLMGTRALTATSGGGFDLMSETVSLNGIIENPSVFVLAQRPGPATGLPTWTGQGDLLMAIHTAHGEFARCVMAVSDSTDAFHLMNDAFTIAEEYQTPVIVLTDKQIAEALYTEAPYNQKKAKIKRGNLVTDPEKLKKLKSTDRYNPDAKDGISPRWLPGSLAATYAAQGDEHSADGTVDESSSNAIKQMDKRLRKMAALKAKLPEPLLYREANDKWLVASGIDTDLDVLLIGWGSTKPVVLDALQTFKPSNLQAAYLHYTYLWPIKTDFLQSLALKAKKIVVVEGNATSQLSMLLKQEGVRIDHEILKYDGRPFFVDELQRHIEETLSTAVSPRINSGANNRSS
ncbi:MAG: 2-oxoacid:acceptor oxidoreductase subunit alpha [Candidatus Peribacteraceae bacterium]